MSGMKPIERFARHDSTRVLTESEARAILRQAQGMARGWTMDSRGFVFIENEAVKTESPLFTIAAREHNDAKMAAARGEQWSVTLPAGATPLVITLGAPRS